MSVEGKVITDNVVVAKVDAVRTVNGKNAYEMAVLHGYTGTFEDWIASVTSGRLTEGHKEAIVESVAKKYEDNLCDIEENLAFKVASEQSSRQREDARLESLIGADAEAVENSYNNYYRRLAERVDDVLGFDSIGYSELKQGFRYWVVENSDGTYTLEQEIEYEVEDYEAFLSYILTFTRIYDFTPFRGSRIRCRSREWDGEAGKYTDKFGWVKSYVNGFSYGYALYNDFGDIIKGGNAVTSADGSLIGYDFVIDVPQNAGKFIISSHHSNNILFSNESVFQLSKNVNKLLKRVPNVDEIVIVGSTNPVSSNAVAEAIDGVRGEIPTVDEVVTYGSKNPVSGDAVSKYIIASEAGLRNYVDNKIGAAKKVYTSADFGNDYRSIGTGWTTSDLAISNTDLLKVKAGDEVSITVPVGFRVDIKVINSEDFAEPGTISLVEDAKSNITESLNHTFINSGYLDIMVRKPVSSGFTSISPSDYACDIKVETKGILDRMDDAEKRLGEVDNLLEEIGGNVEKNKTSVDTLTKQVLEVVPEKTYTSADFIQGWRQLGIGFENVTTYITNAELLKVEAGDKITINPNGYKLWVSVADTDDYSVSGKTYSLNEPNVTEYFEHTFEKNGYLNINVNNFGHRINPSDYTCDITVVLDDTKHRLTEIENNSKSAEILSPKSRPFTTIVDDCQDKSKWTITNKSVSAVDETENGKIMWGQSLHCDGRMRCTQTTYDLLNNDLVIKIRINSIPYGEEYKGNGIYMRLSNTSTPSIGAKYCLMQGAETTPLGAWREITIPYTGYINKDKPELDFSAINDIDIFADQGSTDTNYDGTADWNIQYIGIRPRKLNKGIVSFTFDDGYKSQYTGVKLLAEKGISSTIYHIAEATGQSTEILSIEELQELVNYYGADIEVHGDIPENESGENGYNALSDEELIKHWTDSQRFLKENGLSDGRHMSYPGNYHSNRVVQLAKRFFDSCRTIQYYIPCESYPPADHYRLRAVSSVSAALNDVDTIKRYIDRAMESGSWLILTFHRIGDVQGDSMYCSESDLQAIADYAIESGAIIKNIAEVYNTTSINMGGSASSCDFESRIVTVEDFEGEDEQITDNVVPSMALFYNAFVGHEERLCAIEGKHFQALQLLGGAD